MDQTLLIPSYNTKAPGTWPYIHHTLQTIPTHNIFLSLPSSISAISYPTHAMKLTFGYREHTKNCASSMGIPWTTQLPNDVILLLTEDLKHIIFTLFIDISSRLDIQGFDRSLGILGLGNSHKNLYFISCYGRMLISMYIRELPERGPFWFWGGTNERTIDRPKKVLTRRSETME